MQTLAEPKLSVTKGRERKFFLSWYIRDDREKCTIPSEHHATSNGRQWRGFSFYPDLREISSTVKEGGGPLYSGHPKDKQRLVYRLFPDEI
jgi:hypothetical protein